MHSSMASEVSGGNTLDEVASEISNLTHRVQTFDYSQLRCITVSDGSETYHGASKQALTALSAMFAETFKYSRSATIRNYFKSIKHQPKSELENIRNLANTLLTFKQRIQEAELEFFRQKDADQSSPYQRNVSNLTGNSTWVTRFHFLIEKFPDSMNYLAGNYRNIIDNIQTLGEQVFVYLQEHDKKNCALFQTLSSKDKAVSLKRSAADRKVQLELFHDDIENKSPENLLRVSEKLQSKRACSDSFFSNLAAKSDTISTDNAKKPSTNPKNKPRP
jgi:hypothetical protein